MINNWEWSRLTETLVAPGMKFYEAEKEARRQLEFREARQQREEEARSREAEDLRKASPTLAMINAPAPPPERESPDRNGDGYFFDG